MNKLWRAKLKAFSAHLLFSAVLIGLFMYVIMSHWFPGYLFELENVWQGLRILVPVDAILGPLLTLIIFVPDKKGLKGDLAIILVLQIAALVYGGKVIYDSKPEVLAFVGDRFEVITKSSYDPSLIPKQTLSVFESSNPALIYPLPAQSREESNQFVLNNTQYQLLADRYRPVNDYKDKVFARALEIERIKPTVASQIDVLTSFKNRYNAESDALFILQGTTKDFVIVSIDRNDLQVKDYLPIDPWANYDFPEK